MSGRKIKVVMPARDGAMPLAYFQEVAFDGDGVSEGPLLPEVEEGIRLYFPSMVIGEPGRSIGKAEDFLPQLFH